MIMKINQNDAARYIESRSEFQGYGSLRGTGLNSSHGGIRSDAGRLPEPYRSEFYAAQPKVVPHGQPGGYGQPGTICYVVFSYDTPIAWYVVDHGWVRPPVKYSVTTSRHQGKCPVSA
jgi:hypothetical protein